MMKKFLFASLSLLAAAATILVAVGQGGSPPPQPIGSGTIEACGAAPGGDPSVEIEGPTGTNGCGTITVTDVTVGGVAVSKDDYTVNDQGSTSPEVVFHSGHTPAAGATVCVQGTTSKGDREFEGTLKWQ